MKYRKYIESFFLIDDPKTGQLVPFLFRPVQAKYYNELIRDYDIETKGISVPVREIILKARREGFSSLILALFAADDILQDNPTETLVISYRDDATDTFRKRYRNYVLSAAARRAGATVEQIQKNPAILDEMAKHVLSVDSNELELTHNKAHFYCGTASARTGGRGGVLQKLLFSEEAHYPDTEKMLAKEIIEGTLRQVDIASGFVFRESTANGYGNYYEQTWAAAVNGESRFKPRFYGWREMYSAEEFVTIASEFTDKKILKQEYPETPRDAFISSGTGYFDNEIIFELIKGEAIDPRWVGNMELVCCHQNKCRSLEQCAALTSKFTENAEGRCRIWSLPEPYASYVLGADVAEGVEGDYSTIKVKDNRTLKTVASFSSNTVEPGEFALIIYALGSWYNWAYAGVEVNKDGLWVNDTLHKMKYRNLYQREQFDDVDKKVSKKVGFRTDERTRPYILSELRSVLASHTGIWVDKSLLEQCLVFIRNKVGRPQAMSGKHDDEIMAEAICLEIRRNAPAAYVPQHLAPQKSFDPFSTAGD